MSRDAAAMAAPRCPIKRISQTLSLGVFYMHILLLLSFLGIATARRAEGVANGAWSKCPISRRLTAFQPSNVPGLRQQQSSTATFTHNRSPALSLRSEASARRRRARPTWMSAVEDQQTTVAAAAADAGSKKAKRKENSTAPLQVHVIGLSHHNAALEVREKLAVPEANWNMESEALCEQDSIVEAAVLSTCNRFETYIAAHDAHAAIRETIAHLQQRSGLSQATLRRSLFILSGEDAVWHLLRVSAGLDSLVVGEGQILSQVRQCYLHGTEEGGSAGKVVARLLNTAVSAGKRARAETSISKGAVSISSAAAEFSKHRCEFDIQKPFLEARLTIVGAGTMSRLLLIHLQSLGIKEVTLVNRSMPKCLELQAEFDAIKFNLHLADELDAVVAKSDIVYTGTSATGCIVTRDRLRELGVGAAHPVMFVDISVPRNVESECNEVDGVHAYDVDDLKMVVARNTAMRRKEMLEAEAILVEEQIKFQGWQQSLTAIPAISKMQEKFEAMRAEEVRKAANKLASLSPKEMEVVEKLSKGIVNKMLHGPMSALRQPEGPEEKKRTLATLKTMFRLEKDLID
ncbi:Glutamyl-tRNA Reductase, chloroplast precursor [Tribonema minus]|uniref:Glutamyl-tRNA reductase n=1 Tax=Tribonema minus TaxID=303371 RepID=A0A836CGD2_9STRA|nr:Glutamyl-tRNA Reductase, chloroplast precursor [Tribonema minus]